MRWVLLIFGIYFGQEFDWRSHWTPKLHNLLFIILGVAFVTLQGFLINYIGDAARYLDPSPENIAFRREVRAAGLQLLRRLHRDNQYDRVILVGHSLGSIIAYDILTHFWEECHSSHRSPHDVNQSALREIELLGQSLDGSARTRAAFARGQRDLWLEQRRLGNPWLVTDLITIGSPLAHAELLLARSQKDLQDRILQRELPTCPPQPDDHGYSYKVNYDASGPSNANLPKQRRTIRVLHHAALFACVKWTNLYYPALLGLFGDLVGGRLDRVFGLGIEDIPVTSSLWFGLKRFTPLIHTCYWQPRDRALRRTSRTPSLYALLAALDLESKTWLNRI